MTRIVQYSLSNSRRRSAGDGLDDIGDPELPRRLGRALRAATEPYGARAYRLDAALSAFLGPIEAGALTPAASAHGALSAVSENLASGVVRGEARIPDEAPDGTTALATAHERLRARSRWQGLSSERQARYVLLQILSERRAGGSAFEELCRCAGRQFDPMVVAAFCAEMNQLDPQSAVAARARPAAV